MTASFTEQMVNLYIALGILSSSNLFRLPSWGGVRSGMQPDPTLSLLR
jgi:hypothetical protein